MKSGTKARPTSVVKVGTRRDVRLPGDVTRRLKIRAGSRLEVFVSGSGVFLIPPNRIPKAQRYFYTKEWQAKERGADDDVAKGRVKAFSDVEALIRDLRS